MKIISVSLVVAIFSLFLFSGCSSKIIETKFSSSKQSSKGSETTLSNSVQSSYSNKIPLSKSELNAIQDFFNSQDTNGFILTLYKEPKFIDLSRVLYSNERGQAVTDDKEFLEVLQIDDSEGCLELRKFTKSVIDNLLKEKAGITMDDLVKPFDDEYCKFIYNKKYNAYYWYGSDTNYENAVCKSGTMSKDNIYTVKYEISNCNESVFQTAVLKKSGDKYIFISNLKS